MNALRGFGFLFELDFFFFYWLEKSSSKEYEKVLQKYINRILFSFIIRH